MRTRDARELYAECLKGIRNNMTYFLGNMHDGEPIFNATEKQQKKTGDIRPAKNTVIYSDTVTISSFADIDLKIHLHCNNVGCEFWKAGDNSNSPARCLLERPMDLPDDILKQAKKARAGIRDARFAEED